jgi:hypothetical protein
MTSKTCGDSLLQIVIVEMSSDVCYCPRYDTMCVSNCQHLETKISAELGILLEIVRSKSSLVMAANKKKN